MGGEYEVTSSIQWDVGSLLSQMSSAVVDQLYKMICGMNLLTTERDAERDGR